MQIKVILFDWLKTSLEKVTPPIQLDIKHLGRPPGAMSATLVRKTVQDGNFDTFMNMYSTSGLSKQRATLLYSQLRSQLPSSSSQIKKRKRGEGGGRISYVKL